MQRREFIAAVATAAVAGAAAPPAVARAPAVPNRPVDYAALEAAAGACLDAGEDCLRLCFGELAAADRRLSACAEAAYELVTACRAVRSLAAVKSTHVPIFARALAQACIACRSECEQFPDVEACRILGAACGTCAEECRFTA